MSHQGPTQGASPGLANRWQSRPVLAGCLRVAITLLPIAITLIVSFAIARLVPPIESTSARLGWWSILLITTLASLMFCDRAMRQLTPLEALLKLSLIFPDEAPSRFGVALKARNTRSVARQVEAEKSRLRSAAQPVDDPTGHAVRMLELVALLSAHDRLTRGHSERVRAYTDLIMEEMGIGSEDADRLRWAALLHDIGKLSVPSEILNKTTKPDAQEWELLKGHAAAGHQIVEPLQAWLGDWIRTVGEHHERWDGGGYPNGLAGEDIHLGARIVAVADTYDVITSARSYKKPIPAADARAEIARNAGTQFDPKVARAFLSISIGRLRFVAGPLAWIASVASLSSAPVGTAGSFAAAALTVATVSGVVVPTEVFEPAEPDQLSFATTSSTPNSTISTQVTPVDPPTAVLSTQPGRPVSPPSTTTVKSASTNFTTTAPQTTTSAQVTPTAPVSDGPTTTIPPDTAPSTTQPPTSVATTTTVPTTTPILSVSNDRFAMDNTTWTGDIVAFLAVDQHTNSVSWEPAGNPWPFTLSADGVIALGDAQMLIDDGLYGTDVNLAVKATADDGRTAEADVRIAIDALPTSTAGIVLSEIVPSRGPSASAFVEVLNTSPEPRLIERLQLSVRGWHSTDVVYSGPFVLLPGEVMLLTTGPPPPGVKASVLPTTDHLRLHDNTSKIAVRLSVASDPTANINSPSHIVDSFATRGYELLLSQGFGEGVPSGSAPLTTVSYHRVGAGVGSCQDTGNNNNDFQLRISDLGGVATPGIADCTPIAPVAQTAASSLVISEINTRGLGEHTEYVELFNPTDSTIPLTGVWLHSSDLSGAAAFALPLDGFGSLAPGQRLLIVDRFFATGPAGAIAGYDDPDTSDWRLFHPDDIRAGTFRLALTDGTVIDEVGIGTPGGLPRDSHGVSSWARRYDGNHKTGNVLQDFEYVAVGTPRGSSLW